MNKIADTFKAHLANLKAAFAPKADPKPKKPWQQGKAWCTKPDTRVRVLWDVVARGEAYCYKKHGPLPSR